LDKVMKDFVDNPHHVVATAQPTEEEPVEWLM
jgi:hypothetical protein